MIVTAVLTLTLSMHQPDDLVQVFSPTQHVTITMPARNGCVQSDAWLVQCWAEASQQLPLQLSYTCNDPLAVVVIKTDLFVRLFEMTCRRWRNYLPLVAVQ